MNDRDIIWEYKAGKSMKAIAEEMGHSYHKVRETLRKANDVRIRTTRETNTKIDPVKLAVLLRGPDSIATIARKFGAQPNSVCAAARRIGIDPRNRHNEDEP